MSTTTRQTSRWRVPLRRESRPTARVACIVAAALALTAIAIALAPRATGSDPTVDVIVHLGLVVGIASAVLILKGSASPTVKAIGVVAVLALYVMLAASLVLSGSPFPPLGYALDESFRTAYVTKLAHGWTDFAYRGLPPWYAPLYFGILAQASNLLGISPWETLKFGVIAAGTAVPLISFVLWSRIVDWVTAAAIAAAVLLIESWYEPYRWLAVVTLLPWLLIVWRLRRPSAVRLIGLGLLGAVQFLLYPVYIVFVGALGTAVLMLGGRWWSALDDVRPRDGRAVAGVFGISILASSWWWAPLIARGLSDGVWRTEANRFYDASMVNLPAPFLEFSVKGMLLLAGLVFLLVTCREPLSKALLVVLATTYLWVALSYVGVLVDVGTMPHLAPVFISWLLACALMIGVVRGARRLREEHRAALPIAVAAALIVGVIVAQTVPGNIPFVKEQRKATFPARLLDDYSAVVGGGDQVVLSGVQELVVFLPDVWSFNVWNSNYANPTAAWRSRQQMIKLLAREQDPDVEALVLRHNRFDPVDQVVFPAGQLNYDWIQDRFPDGVKSHRITWRADALARLDYRQTSKLNIFLVPEADLSTTGCPTILGAAKRYRGLLDDAVEHRASQCRT